MLWSICEVEERELIINTCKMLALPGGIRVMEKAVMNIIKGVGGGSDLHKILWMLKAGSNGIP